IGPNGAGKSTLTKMLTTLLPPTSGSASVAGFDIARHSREARRHLGYVPQTISADGTLTGYENLLLSCGLYGISRGEQSLRIEEALATLGLKDVAARLAGHYSGGMLRRLEIAQSILHRPTVLFMDEPTVGLDPTARRAVWSHLQGLRSVLRTTMIITTHYLDEVEELCDHVAMIAQGRIVAQGTPAELRGKVGPTASLEDAFKDLLLAHPQDQLQQGYDSVGQDRRAEQRHG
ncbi:MAG TPA: ATP-binding cassette domain-containing protein, partial [Stellaceae bacterium]|nr:ATP-binding cassette domain-containing protein [Stellaceae bacterium]